MYDGDIHHLIKQLRTWRTKMLIILKSAVSAVQLQKDGKTLFLDLMPGVGRHIRIGDLRVENDKQVGVISKSLNKSPGLDDEAVYPNVGRACKLYRPSANMLSIIVEDEETTLFELGAAVLDVLEKSLPL
jgi:hypothetical protein